MNNVIKVDNQAWIDNNRSVLTPRQRLLADSRVLRMVDHVPTPVPAQHDKFDDRVVRIRQGLNNINQLMQDMRKQRRTEDQLDELVYAINEEIRRTEEYVQDDGHFYAESAWDDAKGQLDRSAIDDDDLREAVADWDDARLMEFCRLEYTSGIHARYDELFSMSIGEYEHELSETIGDELEHLTAEDHEYIRDRIEAYMPKGEVAYITINLEYDRWSVILDTDALAEAVEQTA